MCNLKIIDYFVHYTSSLLDNKVIQVEWEIYWEAKSTL